MVVLFKVKLCPTKNYAEELHKSFIRKFVHLSFIDNIWGVNLTDMQLISKFNKRFWFLLCSIDIYNKFAWVVPLKDKKGIRSNVTNNLQQMLDESNRKLKIIWVTVCYYHVKYVFQSESTL